MDLRTLTGLFGMLCVSAALLTACGGEQENLQPVTQPQQLFMLSADGVGPLNADTPFNLVRIGQAFQDYNVAEETHFLKGDKYPVITVKQKVTPLLSINPDHRQQDVFSIVVHSNLIGNRLGHRLGDKYSEIYTYGKTEECGPGIEEWAGKVMCYAPQTGNILYLFAGSRGDDEKLLPAPEVMADWELEAIVWKPPGR